MYMAEEKGAELGVEIAIVIGGGNILDIGHLVQMAWIVLRQIIRDVKPLRMHF